MPRLLNSLAEVPLAPFGEAEAESRKITELTAEDQGGLPTQQWADCLPAALKPLLP